MHGHPSYLCATGFTKNILLSLTQISFFIFTVVHVASVLGLSLLHADIQQLIYIVFTNFVQNNQLRYMKH